MVPSKVWYIHHIAVWRRKALRTITAFQMWSMADESSLLGCESLAFVEITINFAQKPPETIEKSKKKKEIHVLKNPESKSWRKANWDAAGRSLSRHSRHIDVEQIAAVECRNGPESCSSLTSSYGKHLLFYKVTFKSSPIFSGPLSVFSRHVKSTAVSRVITEHVVENPPAYLECYQSARLLFFCSETDFVVPLGVTNLFVSTSDASHTKHRRI